MKKVMFCIFLILFLAGCIKPIIPTKLSIDIESSYDVGFDKVIMVLQDIGYVINQADKGSGLITTEYRDRGSVFAVFAVYYLRDRLNIFIKKNGDSQFLSIYITLLNEMRTSGEYGPGPWFQTSSNEKELNNIIQKIKEKF